MKVPQKVSTSLGSRHIPGHKSQIMLAISSEQALSFSSSRPCSFITTKPCSNKTRTRGSVNTLAKGRLFHFPLGEEGKEDEEDEEFDNIETKKNLKPKQEEGDNDFFLFTMINSVACD